MWGLLRACPRGLTGGVREMQHSEGGMPGVVNSPLGHGNFRELLRAHGKHHCNPCEITSQTHLGILTSQPLFPPLLPPALTQEGSETIVSPGGRKQA